jgi:hypothetical protein
MNGRTPLYLSVALVAVFVGAMLALQPYSARWPGKAYATQVERYLRAAIIQDSLQLRRLSVSRAPATWMLEGGRTHRLDPWEQGVDIWTGERRGDTAEVFVYPSGRTCEASPIVFRFIGSGSRAKVLDVQSSCTLP